MGLCQANWGRECAGTRGRTGILYREFWQRFSDCATPSKKLPTATHAGRPPLSSGLVIHERVLRPSDTKYKEIPATPTERGAGGGEDRCLSTLPMNPKRPKHIQCLVLTLKIHFRDFPGGPVVKMPSSRFNPWSGN